MKPKQTIKKKCQNCIYWDLLSVGCKNENVKKMVFVNLPYHQHLHMTHNIIFKPDFCCQYWEGYKQKIPKSIPLNYPKEIKIKRKGLKSTLKMKGNFIEGNMYIEK